MQSMVHISTLVAPTLGQEVLACLVRYLCYIIPFAATLIAVHFLMDIPREVFRKMLHVAAFTSPPMIMLASGSWLVSVLVLVLFGLVVWPLLAIAEHAGWYADLFVQRRAHEVRRSLLVMFWGNAAVVALCWGLFAKPQVAVASILMWGFGDAAAALVGTRWGKHHTGLPLADPKKTWEGTGAMFVVSCVIGWAVLLVAGTPLVGSLASAALTAAVGAYVELVTRRGYDTITVPLANACVLLLVT
jgi:dolichol kinase